MTNEKTTSEKQRVEFTGCKTCGDEIKALVREYTGRTLGNFVLQRALEEVERNDRKIKEYKEKLLKGGNK